MFGDVQGRRALHQQLARPSTRTRRLSVLLMVLPSASMVTKRSVSLADAVASAVEQAAKQDGVSFSAWLSNAAEKQLRVRQGLRGVAAWEGETGSLSAEELAAGEALLARLRSGVSGVASRVRRR